MEEKLDELEEEIDDYAFACEWAEATERFWRNWFSREWSAAVRGLAR